MGCRGGWGWGSGRGGDGLQVGRLEGWRAGKWGKGGVGACAELLG